MRYSMRYMKNCTTSSFVVCFNIASTCPQNSFHRCPYPTATPGSSHCGTQFDPIAERLHVRSVASESVAQMPKAQVGQQQCGNSGGFGLERSEWVVDDRVALLVLRAEHLEVPEFRHLPKITFAANNGLSLMTLYANCCCGRCGAVRRANSTTDGAMLAGRHG